MGFADSWHAIFCTRQVLDDRLQALRQADEVRQAEQAKRAIEDRATQEALEAQRAERAQELARRLETLEGALEAVPQRVDVLERNTEALGAPTTSLQVACLDLGSLLPEASESFSETPMNFTEIIEEMTGSSRRTFVSFCFRPMLHQGATPIAICNLPITWLQGALSLGFLV